MLVWVYVWQVVEQLLNPDACTHMYTHAHTHTHTSMKTVSSIAVLAFGEGVKVAQSCPALCDPMDDAFGRYTINI